MDSLSDRCRKRSRCRRIVELIGDMDKTASKVIKEAINNGKHVVTANKSLLAKEGSIFEELAREKVFF